MARRILPGTCSASTAASVCSFSSQRCEEQRGESVRGQMEWPEAETRGQQHGGQRASNNHGQGRVVRDASRDRGTHTVVRIHKRRPESAMEQVAVAQHA